MMTDDKKQEAVATAQLLHWLVLSGPRLASMPHGDNGMVGIWWRGLSENGRREQFQTLNLARRFVDLKNGAPPWPATRAFDNATGCDELDRLERRMLSFANHLMSA